jgi:hypothetical protein
MEKRAFSYGGRQFFNTKIGEYSDLPEAITQEAKTPARALAAPAVHLVKQQVYTDTVAVYQSRIRTGFLTYAILASLGSDTFVPACPAVVLIILEIHTGTLAGCVSRWTTAHTMTLVTDFGQVITIFITGSAMGRFVSPGHEADALPVVVTISGSGRARIDTPAINTILTIRALIFT